ncbi:hypothetical protein GD1_17 [Paraglaciecola Antarctic GD virus 1]|nr:hypothetical protein GD1_17 [Paraglaciecola Antarctic GD virus 1]
MSAVTLLIEKRKKVTKKAILQDLLAGDWDALYFATEEQISSLIDSGKIDEDFSSRHQDYQEEMRVLKAEFV